MRRRLSCGITPSQITVALRLCMSELSASRPEKALVSIETFDASLKQIMAPRDEMILAECSVVELLLLLCVKKLSDKELPPPHTLRMALREYTVFCSSTGCAHYDYPKPLLVKSFEHLCALGLVFADRTGRGRQPIEQVPLRLGTDQQTLHDYVKSHQELPLEVQRWGSQWTT